MSTIVASAVSLTEGDRTTVSAAERDQPLCITDDQKEILEGTWKTIEDNQQGVGLLLFRRLFEIAPQAVALFPKFVDIPAEDRENNEDYRRHALQVVEAVGLAIGMLDDATALEAVLENLGAAHCNHKIQDPHFDLVGQALMWTLGEGFGEGFTPQVREAWTVFYNFVTVHMMRGLHQARRDAEGK